MPPTASATTPPAPRLSTPWPATRGAAWWLRPAPGPARPGCWSRACCAPCSTARNRSRFWPSPSPARPPARCASGWTNGCWRFRTPAATRLPALKPCATVARRRRKRRRWRRPWACCRKRCCAAAAASRCAPSTPGSRNCCRTRLCRCCKACSCRGPMNCWKTPARCAKRCSAASTAACRTTPACAPTTWRWWPGTAAALCCNG